MKHGLMALAALCLATPVDAQQSTIDLVQAIAEQRQDPVTADYGRIIYPQGDADRAIAEAMLRQYVADLLHEAERGGRAISSVKSCWSHAIATGMDAATRAGSYDAYRADLDEALAWHSALKTDAGEQAQEAANAAPSELAGELARRRHWDQAWRQQFGMMFMNGMPTGGAPFIKINMAMAEMCRTDLDNVDYITGLLGEIEWPSISEYGEDADAHAWIIVQHAPLSLQEEILPRLERLWQAGDTNPRNYAMLHDRVMMRLGQPQRYGSQYVCRDNA